MPSFTQTEKDTIKQQLMNSAKEMFATKGLKKTSLDDLTSAVGISKSSFYVFFESKEVLYLELLDQEGPGLEERVWKAVDQKETTQEKINTYLHEMTRELDANPLMKRLQTHPEELQLVERKVTPEFLQKKTKRNVLPLLDFLTKQQEAGDIIAEEPVVILSTIRAAMTISRHKKDIGPDVYPKVQNMMFDAISTFLTDTNKQQE
jgi:AcrR family transcriptional regulator